MKLVCIGQNYADHAAELGSELPSEPMFFNKPESAILPEGREFELPTWAKEIHHELELVLRISRTARRVTEPTALAHVDALTLGLDFTARDVQRNLRAAGHPWEKAKAFDGAAVIGSPFIPLTQLGPLSSLEFRLEKNGVVVQRGHVSNMVFPPERLIAHVSQFMTLNVGDLLFTGTPAGVGPVGDGDELVGYLGETELVRVRCRAD